MDRAGIEPVLAAPIRPDRLDVSHSDLSACSTTAVLITAPSIFSSFSYFSPLSKSSPISPPSTAWCSEIGMASNAMTRTQTIFCFSVRDPDSALSPLTIHFECVQISVFCYIFVIVDRSKAITSKCLRGKHLTSNTLKT